jgi:hypothetical protein
MNELINSIIDLLLIRVNSEKCRFYAKQDEKTGGMSKK